MKSTLALAVLAGVVSASPLSGAHDALRSVRSSVQSVKAQFSGMTQRFSDTYDNAHSTLLKTRAQHFSTLGEPSTSIFASFSCEMENACELAECEYQQAFNALSMNTTFQTDVQAMTTTVGTEATATFDAICSLEAWTVFEEHYKTVKETCAEVSQSVAGLSDMLMFCMEDSAGDYCYPQIMSLTMGDAGPENPAAMCEMKECYMMFSMASDDGPGALMVEFYFDTLICLRDTDDQYCVEIVEDTSQQCTSTCFRDFVNTIIAVAEANPEVCAELDMPDDAPDGYEGYYGPDGGWAPPPNDVGYYGPGHAGPDAGFVDGYTGYDGFGGPCVPCGYDGYGGYYPNDDWVGGDDGYGYVPPPNDDMVGYYGPDPIIGVYAYDELPCCPNDYYDYYDDIHQEEEFFLFMGCDPDEAEALRALLSVLCMKTSEDVWCGDILDLDLRGDDYDDYDGYDGYDGCVPCSPGGYDGYDDSGYYGYVPPPTDAYGNPIYDYEEEGYGYYGPDPPVNPYYGFDDVGELPCCPEFNNGDDGFYGYDGGYDGYAPPPTDGVYAPDGDGGFYGPDGPYIDGGGYYDYYEDYDEDVCPEDTCWATECTAACQVELATYVGEGAGGCCRVALAEAFSDIIAGLPESDYLGGGEPVAQEMPEFVMMGYAAKCHVDFVTDVCGITIEGTCDMTNENWPGGPTAGVGGSWTGAPTLAPTAAPTTAPTTAPTAAPTTAPTTAPTAAPTPAPTAAPTTTDVEAELLLSVSTQLQASLCALLLAFATSFILHA